MRKFIIHPKDRFGYWTFSIENLKTKREKGELSKHSKLNWIWSLSKKNFGEKLALKKGVIDLCPTNSKEYWWVLNLVLATRHFKNSSIITTHCYKISLVVRKTQNHTSSLTFSLLMFLRDLEKGFSGIGVKACTWLPKNSTVCKERGKRREM